MPAEPAVTVKSLKHGHEIFAANCAVCHGDEGHGDGVAAAGLTDMWGNPERPANYTLPAGSPGGVKLGHDGKHLFKTVHNGIGGTAMPTFGDSLGAGDIWDAVHFIQSLRIDAHMRELQQAGLQVADEQAARKRLWQNISAAADNGQIELAVLQAHQDSVNSKVAFQQKERPNE